MSKTRSINPFLYYWYYRVFLLLCLLVASIIATTCEGPVEECIANTTTVTGTKILVTGAHGFLGSRVMNQLMLSAEHDEIRTFDLIKGHDILDENAVDAAVKGVDLVIHLAAVSNLNFFTTDGAGGRLINIAGTRNVVESAKRHGAVVLFASTCCAYGNNACHPSHESCPLAPTEPYAQSKAEAEQIVLDADKRNIVMRLATFHGPGMRGDLAVARFLERAHRGEPLLVHGDGRQTRTLTHVDDVAKGIALLARMYKSVQERIFNISTERSVSVLELADIVRNTVGRQVDLIHTGDREGQIFDEQILSERLSALGWREEFSLEEGVLQSYEHYKQYGWASEGAKGVENGTSVLA